MDAHSFLRWWFDRLAELVAGGSPRRGRARDALVLTPDANGVAVAMRRSGRTTPISVNGDPRRLAGLEDLPGSAVVRPAEDQVLHTVVMVPAAAVRHVRKLLPFELERATPFSQDEIVWDHAVGARPAEDGRLPVEVAMVARAAVQPALDFAAAAGLRVDGVEIASPGRAERLLPLVAGNAVAGDIGLRRLAFTAAALGVVALLMPWVGQHQALNRMEDRLAAARITAGDAVALRREIDALADRAEFLARERERSVSVLGTLAAATRALPDESHLDALVLRGERLTLRGQSPRAADLLARFAGAPEFRDPTFLSPIVRTAAGGRETFMIGVALTGAAEAAP